MASLIYFRCESPAHRSNGDPRGHLTINDGRWAFCPAGEVVDGHAWRAIDPEPLERIRRAFVQERASRS